MGRKEKGPLTATYEQKVQKILRKHHERTEAWKIRVQIYGRSKEENYERERPAAQSYERSAVQETDFLIIHYHVLRGGTVATKHTTFITQRPYAW